MIDREYALESLVTSFVRQGHAETLFHSVLRGIQKVLRDSHLTVTDLVGIGIGLPGKADHKNGTAIFQKNIPWPNFPIVKA